MEIKSQNNYDNNQFVAEANFQVHAGDQGEGAFTTSEHHSSMESHTEEDEMNSRKKAISSVAKILVKEIN